MQPGPCCLLIDFRFCQAINGCGARVLFLPMSIWLLNFVGGLEFVLKAFKKHLRTDDGLQ